jgi:chaperone modulatory protein CbpM
MGNDGVVLMGELLEEACYTLDELAAACQVSTRWVEQRIAEGMLGCAGSGGIEWRFSGQDLRRARRLHAIERDFDAVPELAALVADLLEEVEALRSRLHRAGLDPR